MKVRTYTAGLATAALAASSLALAVVAPASADPTNPVFVPSTGLPDATTVGTGDVVGVGSDTIEGVLNDLAQGKGPNAGWNATHANQRIASFDATGSATIVLRSGATAINRPNGSGAGKALLLAGGNPDVSFARSSSSLNASNGEATSLTQFPFAVDGLKMAVSGNVASHAPASLTIADIVNIYKGTYKTWNQIPGNSGGSTAFIHPYVPQTGSGTRSFFLSELKAGNGGVDVTLAVADGGYPGVSETQEHSPTDIQGNADAIAPFSTARAQTLASPGAIHLEDGYRARRAVYDVVRNADAGSAWATSIFGTNGFFCSAAAKPIIEANGFEQLASVAEGGVCGTALTAPPANLNSAGAKVTTTTLAASSNAGHAAHLLATVSATSGVPDGDVDFFEGSTKVGTAIVAGGQATLDLTGLSLGQHTYTAKFVSNETMSFTDSTSTSANVTVRETSTTTATVAAKTYGHPSTATISASTLGNPAAGSVTVKVGAFQATKALSAGSATFTLPANLPAGAKSLVATYSGDTSTAPSSTTKGFTIAKSAVVVSETFPARTKIGKRGKGTVVVALSPGSTVKATGTVVIKRGSKVVGRGTLVNGVVTIKLAKLPKGKNTLVATYGGSANTLAKTLKFTIKQR